MSGRGESGVLVEFFLDAADFVLHGLVAVGAGADFDGGGDAGGTHVVDRFVTFFDGGEDGVPVAFDVGAVGVEVEGEAGVAEDTFAGGDVFADADADAHGDHAEIGDDFHGGAPVIGVVRISAGGSVTS